MSYVSLLKNIPEFLSQPTGIAAIASVGIHGAIALIVPLMPVDSNQPKESSSQKTVGVLELSQTDQSRLPQTPDTNPVALQTQPPLLQNQFPQQPQLNNLPNLDAPTTFLPPLPPPVPTTSSLPPITTIPENYRIAALPQSRPLRFSSKRNFRLNSPDFSVSDKKFTPVNPPSFTPVTPPSFDDKQIVTEAPKPLPIDQLPDLRAAQLPNNLPATPPATITEDNNTNPATTKPSSNAAKLAPIAKAPALGDDLALANQNIPKWQRGSTPNVTELPSKQAEQGEIAQVNSYENLRKALQQQYPNSQEKAVIRSTISTDKPGVEGTVLGVLVVDTEGKVLDMQFQDRSVSPELQKKAREYFSQNAPKGDQQISRHPFSLRFEYNSKNTAESNQEKAPAVVIPNSGTNPSTNNSESTPKVENTSRTLPKLEVNKNQPAPTATVQPSSEQTIKKDDLSSSVQSSQELIRQLQRLRESRKQQQNANPSKN